MKYAFRLNCENAQEFPEIEHLSYYNFSKKYYVTKNTIAEQDPKHKHFISYYPAFSSNPKGVNYGIYCKSMCILHIPWTNTDTTIWGGEEVLDSEICSIWESYLQENENKVFSMDYHL